MDMLATPRQEPIHGSAYIEHEFLTHDQRAGDACELVFDDLDARERAIFLRCGFHPPLAA
ncbi:MAG: hypothetical protein JSR63_09150 [Proteobacteria bacterium]|nr:hypothetical protein [Pseudomonadota bacterium]MBS0218336.1 hypothetical protein [Pseudomonadota bacterium]